MRACVCVCVYVCVRACVRACVCVCLSSLVGVIFVYVDTVYGFYRYSLLCSVGCFSRIKYLDTCFECLIRMCFVFLYLPLFSATEHVSHGQAL